MLRLARYKEADTVIMKDRLEEQTARIIQITGGWGLYDPLHGSDARTQCLKMVSEFGELCAHMFPLSINEIKDDVGDVYVTMITTTLISGGNAQALVDSANAAKLSFQGIDCPSAPYAIGHHIGKASDKIIKGRPSVDSICDALRWLVWFCMSSGIDFCDCVQTAIDEISKRKGKMVNGVFIKEGDEA